MTGRSFFPHHKALLACLRLTPLRIVNQLVPLNQETTPIFSPDFGSKPTISRTGKSTLIPRGTHGYRETRDKPRTPLPQENKPESVSDRKRIWKINSYNFCRTPVCESGPRRTQVKVTPALVT